MRNLLLFVFFLYFGSVSAKNDSILITSLKVLDGYTEEPLGDARIEILDRATANVLVDSMETTFSESSVNGVTTKTYDGCHAYVVRCPSYIFRITHNGYDAEEFTLDIGKSQVKYVFEKPKYLWKKTLTLGDVSVTASRVLMVMKGDTIEYNAANFRLGEGSMLDDLVRSLPGAKLDNNGRITVNGEFVSSLLVNGRDFFNGDPKVALSNLPAYTVNKIKVYRKASKIDEQRNDRTEAERRKDPLVMNVGLKKEYQQGWISNYEVGGGSALDGIDSKKWLARLFAMRYTNHSSLAIYASANNMSDEASPGGKGEWKKADNINGDKTTYMGGVDFSLNPKDTKTEINMSLQAKRQRNSLVANTLRENYYASGNTFEKIDAANKSYTTELKWNGSVNTKLGGVYMFLSPSFYYRNSRQEINENTCATSGIDSIYSRILNQEMRQTAWGLGTTLSGFFRLGKRQNIDYAASVAYNRQTAKNTFADRIAYKESVAENIHQRRKSDVLTPDYRYAASVSYENTGNQDVNEAWLKYRFSTRYEYSQQFNSGHQDLYHNDDDWQTPSAASTVNYMLDEANSYHTTRMERKNSIHPLLGLNMWNAITLNMYSDFDFYNRNIKDFRNSTQKNISHNDFTANPTVELQANLRTGWIGITGSVENTLPDIMYLLDVRDNSNPLLLYRGNSNLSTTRKYTVRGSWNFKAKSYSQMLRVRSDYNKWDNGIGMAQIYNRKNSVTTFMPMNVDGNWSASFSANYNRSIDKGGHLMLTSDARLDYNHSVDFTGTTSDADFQGGNEAQGMLNLQEVNNFTVFEELRLDYRMKSLNIAAKANVKWTKLTSPATDFSDFSYTDFSYGVSVSAPTLLGIELATDLMVYNRRGYSDTGMNTTDWVWNASLQKAFGKRKQWLVKAVGFDLLQQLASVRRSINAQGRTEIRYNTIPSYATLNLVYRLDVKPKKKN